ncbi:MOSC domain-containing protein [Knoellia sp. CPCC 206453]|uniref:MOSC domain-containing protein n=1 Tax=Knoellia pratensis TaxID=3404796 RepID=UPI00360AA9A4
MSNVHVVGLNVHPVKSTAIRPVKSAAVELAGFAGDRRWMVVDAEGVLVSARELPRLFSIAADTPETSSDVTTGLRLRADGLGDLHIATDPGDEIPIRMFSNDLTGVLVSAEADAWVSEAVGTSGLRLVRCPDPTRRALKPGLGREGDHTAYADAVPVTLASLKSLAQLNDWVAEGAVGRGDELPATLPVHRFRPNVVMDGDLEAFVEDTWSHVQLGDVTFRVTGPVSRCVMTTIDTDDLAKGKEPIRTLARHRRWDGKTWFSIQLIPDGAGVVRVGDEVEPS